MLVPINFMNAITVLHELINFITQIVVYVYIEESEEVNTSLKKKN